MAPSTEPKAGRWHALSALLGANALAWVGTRLASLAVPWFVLSTTGSALQTGAVVFAQMAPYVLAQALSGPIIDRIGPKRVSVVCDLIVAGVLALVPILHVAGVLSLPLLMGLLAIVGAADGPANAAKGVFVPEVTRLAGVPLERTTGLVGTVERTASTVGPAIGGLVIGLWGGAASLGITAGLAALSAVVVAVAMPGTAKRATGDQDSGGYLAQLKGGFTFLRDEPLLRSIYAMVALTNLLDTAIFSVLLPVWAMGMGYGPELIGLLASVLSAAAIGSSLTAAAYGHRLPRRLIYLLGFLVGGAPRFIVLAFDAPLAAVIAVYAVAGAAIGFVNPIIGAIQFERIPHELLGRVRSLGSSLSWLGIPFGGLVAGSLVTGAGVSAALLLCGGAYLLTTLLPSLLPQWAQMDRERAKGEERAARGA